MQDAKEKHIIVKDVAAASNDEIRILEAAAAAPEVPFGFSVPLADEPALRAAAIVNAKNAMSEAKRARTDAIYAGEDAKTDIRLVENYRAFITHDIERTRDDMKSRKGLN